MTAALVDDVDEIVELTKDDDEEVVAALVNGGTIDCAWLPPLKDDVELNVRVEREMLRCGVVVVEEELGVGELSSRNVRESMSVGLR